MNCFNCKQKIEGWRNKNLKRVFCSRTCYLTVHKIGVQRCVNCDEVFKSKYRKRQFCSNRCVGLKIGYKQGHSLSLRSREKMSLTKLSRSGCTTEKTICKNCNKEFSFRKYKNKNRTFCSKKCLLKKGARFGIKLSEAKRNEMSKKYSGKNNPCWRGGLSKSRFPLYSGPKYRDWRKAVFERDDFTCQICGERGGKLEADHIKPWSQFKEGWFAIDNGRTLCKPCHKEITRQFMKKNWVNQFS